MDTKHEFVENWFPPPPQINPLTSLSNEQLNREWSWKPKIIIIKKRVKTNVDDNVFFCLYVCLYRAVSWGLRQLWHCWRRLQTLRRVWLDCLVTRPCVSLLWSVSIWWGTCLILINYINLPQCASFSPPFNSLVWLLQAPSLIIPTY